MSALTHLSPDVLEVLHDVAKQEDSFLLRVQRVPLEKMADERQPLLRSSAPFLSPAEKHLLDCYRDEVGLAFETALYLAVTAWSTEPETVIYSEPIVRYESLLNREGRRRVTRDWVAQTNHGNEHVGLNATCDSPNWKTLAVQALTVRRRGASLVNASRGYALSGEARLSSQLMGQAASRFDVDLQVYYSNHAFSSYVGGSHSAAARSYRCAYELLPDPRFLACCYLNSVLSQEPIAPSLREEAEVTLSEHIPWLSGALRSRSSRYALSAQSIEMISDSDPLLARWLSE
ncbi:hypothetical protein Pla163_02750 [Planctomycetes bacterium Pla163]|uniref:Uncharacterized protein n=1 Tax=Rohdeia mirabilis TaxID=2528008 RepID=A0A518CVG1_9BACT|nr:hypothetical protein Pla163_02750 [Planctomycetes bacterium Pla163]